MDVHGHKCILTIGNFDGVHRGHQAILRCARSEAGKRGLPVVVLTFDPFPICVLRPQAAPRTLMSIDARVTVLKRVGADEVRVITPTKEFLSQTPTEFVEWLQQTFAPAVIIEGENFRFGRERAGDMDTLAQLGVGAGFSVVAVPPQKVNLPGGTEVRASSTLIRTLLAEGRHAEADFIMGGKPCVP